MYIQIVKDMRNNKVRVTSSPCFTFAQSTKYRNRATGSLLRKLNNAPFSTRMFLVGQLIHQRYYPEFFDKWNVIKDSESNDEVIMIIASEQFCEIALQKAIRNIKNTEDNICD